MSEINQETIQLLLANESKMLEECQHNKTTLALTQQNFNPLQYHYNLGGWDALILYHETQIGLLEAMLPEVVSNVLVVGFKRDSNGSK
jgi:hypothetical protein